MAKQPVADDPIRLHATVVMPLPQDRDELFTLVVQTRNILVGEPGPRPLHFNLKFKPFVMLDNSGHIHVISPVRAGVQVGPLLGQPKGWLKNGQPRLCWRGHPLNFVSQSAGPQ